MIFRLSNAPALDVANVINELLRGERAAEPDDAPDIVISADPVTNSLLVSARPDDMAQIEEFIKTLDAPKPMVRIQMLIAQIDRPSSDATVTRSDEEPDAERMKRILKLGILDRLDSPEDLAERLTELRERKELNVLSRPQIMTLDNQPAFIRFGEVADSAPAGSIRPGVTVGLTPRIAANGTVAMEIDVEITRADSADEAMIATDGGSAERRKVPVRRLVTTVAQTTISVLDGRTVILGGLMPNGDTQDEEMIIVLTPHIVPPEPRPSPDTRAPAASDGANEVGVPIRPGSKLFKRVPPAPVLPAPVR
jgi:type II secretory pathway component GspD/PulD (secretin)